MKKVAAVAWSTLGLAVALDAIGMFLIKRAVSGAGDGLDAAAILELARRLASAPASIVGLVLFVVAPTLMGYGLSRLDLSVAYPVKVGGSFLCVVALSTLALDEPLTWARALGASLVAAGIGAIVASDPKAAM